MLLGSMDNTERAGPERTEEGLLPPPPSWKEIWGQWETEGTQID